MSWPVTVELGRGLDGAITNETTVGHVSGKDAGLIKAKKKVLKKSSESGIDEIIDIGLVGEVTHVDPHIISCLEKDGFIPVISPVGVGPKGETLNINADYIAASVAAALKAEKLILLTDVPGLMDRKGRIISAVTKRQTKKLFDDGTISGGMMPKVQACLNFIEKGGKLSVITEAFKLADMSYGSKITMDYEDDRR